MCARKWTAHTMDSSAPQTLGGRGHKYDVSSISWSSDGNMLASGSLDKSIIIWNAVDEKLLHTLTGHSDGVYSVAWNPITNTLASGSADKTIKIWDAVNGNLLHTLHTDMITSIAWSPDGKLLACAMFDNPSGSSEPGRVKLWDTSTWTIDRVLSIGGYFTARGWSVAWSLSGDVLACGCADSSIKLWEPSTWVRSTLDGHSNMVISVAWTRGNILASGSMDKTIKIWDTNTKTCLRTLTGHKERVNSVSFNHGSDLLASSAITIKIWNYVNGDLLRTLKPRYSISYTRLFGFVAWRPTGSILASGALDGIVRLWDFYSKRNRINRILIGKDGKGGIPQLNPDVVGRISDMAVGMDPDAAAHFNLLVV